MNGTDSYRVTYGVWIPALALASLLAAQMLAATRAAGQDATFHSFHCRDGTDFVVVFSKGTSRIHVQLDGKAMALPRRLSLSGARYSGSGVTLRIKENAATLGRGRQTTECAST